MLEKIGEIIAILEAVGLSVTAKNNCITAPKSHLFKLHFPRLMKKVVRNKELDKRMMEAVNAFSLDDLESLPEVMTAEDQLRILKGYYAARAISQ